MYWILSLYLIFGWGLISAHAEEPVKIKYTRAELEAKWSARVQSFLDKGIVPLIDLQSSLKRQDGERHLENALPVMDEGGAALIAFDGKQAPRWTEEQRGYRWSYYTNEVVNAYPDRFIPTTNGGTNNNWLREKGSFIRQIEEHVRSGSYAIIGEFDFRHYMSKRQCKRGRTDRDSDIPVDGPNGHRLFRLSSETGVPFVIHHEPENHALDALELMLKEYPKAKVIVTHFGQIRHPEKQRRYGPKLIRRLLMTYPNLYYDISTGHPGRRYRCDSNVLDTVIWQDGFLSSQKDTLKPEYRAILVEFSGRFVVGTDYGGGRRPLAEHLENKIGNIRLILRDLPDQAKHDIGYRNAWKLITGRVWTAASGVGEKRQGARSAPRRETATQYTGIISDSHSHLKGNRANPDGLVKVMDRNNVDKVVIFVKSRGGWTDEDALDVHERYPDRVIPGIGFQNKGWRRLRPQFIREVKNKARSGRFRWIGEVAFRGKIGGRLHVPPNSEVLQELLGLSIETGLPITIHHNPYVNDGESWSRTGEFKELVDNLVREPRASVIWAHWCGLSSPKEIRKLFQRLPNLYCDLAWIYKLTQDDFPTPLVDGKNGFLPEWKKIIEEFPNRFLAAVDNGAGPRQLRDYDRRIRIIRTALGGLNPEVAGKVATKNFHHLIGQKPK